MSKEKIKFVGGVLSHPDVKCLIAPSSKQNAHGDEINYYGVYETTSKTLIGFMKGINRNVTHAAQMGASVVKLGNCRDVIVLEIKGELSFGDGQNLATALMYADLPIRFKLIRCKDVPEALRYMVGLNNTAVNWGLVQYCKSFAHISKDYKKVLQYFAEHTALTTATILAVACGSSISVAKKIARSGELVINNPLVVEKKLKAISNLFFVTGFEGARVTEGIMDYIDYIGIDTYLAEQKKFIANILKAIEHQPDLGLVSQQQAYTFFLKHRPTAE